jgi:hypothetical protein
MPAFECKKCHEEYFTFQGDVAACEKCGTVNRAMGSNAPKPGRPGGGLFIGRMSEEDLEQRLGIKPEPKQSSGFGCIVAIVIVVVIFWLAN